MVEDRSVNEGRDGGPGVQEFLDAGFRSPAPDVFDIFCYEFLYVLRVHGAQFLPQISRDCLEFSLIEPDSMALRTPIDNDGGLAKNHGDHFGALAFHAGSVGHTCVRLLHVFNFVVQPAHGATARLVLQFSKFIFDQPDSLALRAALKINGEDGINKQNLATRRTNIGGFLLLDRVFNRGNIQSEIRLGAAFLHSLVPVRNVDVIDEVREAVPLNGPVIGEYLIDPIQLAAAEPKATAVSAEMQINVVRLQEFHLAQIEVVAAGTLLGLLLRFVRPDLFAVFDASCNFESHPIEVAGVEPEAAAFIARVIGDAVFFRNDLVGGHLGTAIQAFHSRAPLCTCGAHRRRKMNLRVAESGDALTDKIATAYDFSRQKG